MAVSGTVKFDPAIDDIIEEAFERCGVQSRSGYDLFTIRRSLNILFSEWGNRGLIQWKINHANIDLIADQNYYDFAWNAEAATASGKTNAKSCYRSSFTKSYRPL